MSEKKGSLDIIYDDCGDQRIKANRERYINSLKRMIVSNGFTQALRVANIKKAFQEFIDHGKKFAYALERDDGTIFHLIASVEDDEDKEKKKGEADKR